MDVETVFEQPFDFARYLEDHLKDIEDLDERAFARSYVAEALNRIFQQTERTYQQLEHRIYSEIRDTADKYSVHTTVVSRKDYDITNATWYPVLPDDHRETGVDMKEAAGLLKSGSPVRVGSVFLSCDRERCCQVFAGERNFRGKLITSGGTVNTSFRLVQDTRYMDVVEEFYRIYLANDIRWTTMNCGYFLRFCAVEAIPDEELKADAEITGYEVDFEDWEEIISRDMMPVWNIRKLSFDSPEFVVPAIDTRHFEHEFPIRKLGAECGYLIEPRKEIVAFRRTSDSIHIITSEDTFSRWTAWQVTQDVEQKPHYFTHPVLHNARKDSFVKRYTDDSGRLLQSRAEVFRRIEQFDTLGLLRLVDVSLMTDTTEKYYDDYLSVMNVTPAEDGPEAYEELANLNWFISDELVNRAEQRVLLFRFRRTADHYLINDMVSFLISQVQRNFNEYRCEAVIDRKPEGGRAV